MTQNKFTNVIKNRKPLPLLIVALMFEIGVASFYYFRFSDYIQDQFSFAYDLWIVIEAHIILAAVFTLAVMFLPIGFYFVLDSKEKSKTKGSYLSYMFLVFGNLTVMFVEVMITQLSFDINANNTFGIVQSQTGHLTGWGLGFLITITHQVLSYIMANSIIRIREEEEDNEDE